MKGDIYKASKTLLGIFFYEYIAGVSPRFALKKWSSNPRFCDNYFTSIILTYLFLTM